MQKRPQKAYKNLDFLNSKEARSIRIMAEYYEPYHRFRTKKINSTIVFFGSARIKSHEDASALLHQAEQAYTQKKSDDHKAELEHARRMVEFSRYYEESVELSRRLTEWTLNTETGKQKYYITSGGGPGIMEAANRGAELAGGRSVGLNISLPMEQYPNPYITPDLSFEFHYFFMRKYWFVYYAKAIVVFPGGFGTLDEMMEVMTLIQTRKVNKKLPIVLLGRDYWNEVLNIKAMLKWGTISEKDLKLINAFDTVDEAYTFLTKTLPG